MTTETLTILVAEDDLLSRKLIQSYLEDRGHRVIPVENGREAVNAFATHSLDLVILDVRMPVMDGMEACLYIKATMGHQWVPLMMVSSGAEEQEQVAGFDVGADYFLTKPLSFPLLEATVQSSQRIAGLQRQLETRNRELSEYYHQSQVENELAQQMIERIMARAGGDDSRIHQSVRSVEEFSGDVVSTVTIQSGQTYVMVADATGHGLPAAITLLPAMEIFYQMSQRGYGVTSIVRQINRRLRERLPPNHFLAANVIQINPQRHVLYAWNGSCPTAFVVSRDGPISHRLPSAQPPLGVLDDAEFDASVQLCHVEETDRVFACSDGLTETCNESGEMFGISRLEALLASCGWGDTDQSHRDGAQHLVECATDALAQFRGSKMPGDDQSMVALTVRPPPVTARTSAVEIFEPYKPPVSDPSLSGWDFELELRGPDLRYTEVVPTVNQTLENLRLCDSTRQRAFVVLTELLNNALDHGVLDLDSSHKTEDGFEHYIAERQKRLANLERGFIRIMGSRGDFLDHHRLRLMVSDSGSGFEAPAEADAASTDRIYGRGLHLVASLADGLRFMDSGASVEVEFRIDVD